MILLGSIPTSGAPNLPAPRGSFPVSGNPAERSPLGRHSKTSRIRLPQGASTAAAAAAPALVGVAAAFCLSQQAPALAAVQAAAPATQAAHNSTVLDAAYHPARSLAPLLSANRHATEAKRAAALPAAY